MYGHIQTNPLESLSKRATGREISSRAFGPATSDYLQTLLETPVDFAVARAIEIASREQGRSNGADMTQTLWSVVVRSRYDMISRPHLLHHFVWPNELGIYRSAVLAWAGVGVHT